MKPLFSWQRSGSIGGTSTIPTSGREAVLVAVGLSCFISWICVEQVLTIFEAITGSPEGDDQSATVRALQIGRATLATLPPLLFLFLFTAWGAARRAGHGLLAARTAVIAAMSVWLISLTILRYMAPSLLAASG